MMHKQSLGIVPSRQAGFTLIELLVVIAIIALLVALLLPALSKARASAYVAMCAGRQHQLSVATFSYANDFRRDYWTDRYQPYNASYSTTFPGGWVVDRASGDTGWTTGPGYGHHDVYGAKPIWREGYKTYLGAGNAWATVSVDPGASYIPRDAAFDAVGIARHTTYRYFLNEGGYGWGAAVYAPWALSKSSERSGYPALVVVTQCQSVMYNDQKWRVLAHANDHSLFSGRWSSVKEEWRGHNVTFGDGHLKWVSPDMCVPAGTQPLNPGRYEVNMFYQGNAIQTMTVVSGSYHASPWWWNSFSAWGL